MNKHTIPSQSWQVEFGGLSRDALLLELSAQKINLNAYAAMLFFADAFATLNKNELNKNEPEKSNTVHIGEVSVRDLGFRDGAVYADIVEAAKGIGLSLCPIEVAPYFRLAYLTQPNDGQMLTVASTKPFADENYPSGFYLRHSDNSLWLRGYYATADFVWAADSKLAFLQP